VGSTNGYDQYGHFLRANLQVTACLDYQTVVQSGCESFFQPAAPTSTKKCQQKDKKKRKKCKEKQKKKKSKAKSAGLRTAPAIPGASPIDATGVAGATPPADTSGADPPASESTALKDGARVLEFLFGQEGGAAK
jgi:hypothetical protein